MKAEINIADYLAEALGIMAESDGQTSNEYIQEWVILYLQAWSITSRNLTRTPIDRSPGISVASIMSQPSALRESCPDSSRQSSDVRFVWRLKSKSTVPAGTQAASQLVPGNLRWPDFKDLHRRSGYC